MQGPMGLRGPGARIRPLTNNKIKTNKIAFVGQSKEIVLKLLFFNETPQLHEELTLQGFRVHTVMPL